MVSSVSVPSSFTAVQTEVEEKSHTAQSKTDLVDIDEKSEGGSTEFGADDPEDESWSAPSPMSPMPWSWDRVVYFADEVTNGVLVEVVEIESLKEFTKFTKEDRAQADKEWCEKLLQEMDAVDGGITCLRGLVCELSVSANGYKVVQHALETARGEEQASLLREMRGTIRHLASSLHGAEVLQTCLKVLRPKQVKFIAAELVGSAAELACSQAGQAVLCRILERMPATCIAPLLDELTMSVFALCHHPYAIQVVSHLLDYSPHSYKLRTCGILATHEKILRENYVAVPLLWKACHVFQSMRSECA